MVVDEFRLVPLEIQADPNNCGKSPQITWVPYYAASGAAELTCENYSTISADTSSQTYVIYDHLKYDEPWDKPVFCIQDFPSSFLDGNEAATTFKVTCEKMPETTAAPTTPPTEPPTTTIPIVINLPDRPDGEEVVTTTLAGQPIGPQKPTIPPTDPPTTKITTTLMVDDAATGCCDKHLIDINYFNSAGLPTDPEVELIQYGTNQGLGGRHKYSADIAGTNFFSQATGVGNTIFLIPYEHQTDPTACGTSKDITWMLFIGSSEDDFTWHTSNCADTTAAEDADTVVVLSKVTEDKRTGSVCPLDITNTWSNIQGEDTYKFYCGDFTTTTSQFTQECISINGNFTIIW